MLTAIFNDGVKAVRILGLTQWDYGQRLKICGTKIEQETEIHFGLLGERETIVQIAEYVDGDLEVDIPNELLEDGRGIMAYVYISDGIDGKTVRTVSMPVERRARPGDFVNHDNIDAIGFLLANKADDILIEDGFIQLMAGNKEIGKRLRLPGAEGHKEIELKNDGIAISWRYTDSNEWVELVKMSALKGDPGETPEFVIREGHLYAIYNKEE